MVKRCTIKSFVSHSKTKNPADQSFACYALTKAVKLTEKNSSYESNPCLRRLIHTGPDLTLFTSVPVLSGTSKEISHCLFFAREHTLWKQTLTLCQSMLYVSTNMLTCFQLVRFSSNSAINVVDLKVKTDHRKQFYCGNAEQCNMWDMCIYAFGRCFNPKQLELHFMVHFISACIPW